MLHTNRAKTGTLLIVGIIILLAVASLYSLQTRLINAADESVRGIFEGITPCSGMDRTLPQIPENTNCEQMIWKIALYQDPATGTPTTFQLDAAYGLSQQGTTGLQRGESHLNLEGKWTTLDGTKTNPNAVLYQLNPDDPPNAIYFVKLDDRILHLLTQDKALMVGNAAWSYTLNRTDKSTLNNPAAVADLTPSTPSPINAGVADSGIFEGRTPCADMLLAIYDLATPGCQRAKWQLTLHLSAETDAPAAFELLNVYVGLGNTQYRASGTWTVFRGTKTHPGALIYQLQPDGERGALFFLKADDNLLFLLDADLNFMVGDALASFTLNRKS